MNRQTISNILPRPVKRGIQFVRALPGRRMRRQLTGSYEIPGGYKRIYHFHIRKTAGTSINRAFFGIAGMDGQQVQSALFQSRGRNWAIFGDYVFVLHNKHLIEAGDYYYGYSHSAQHEIRIPDGTFTLTCLRDPAKRIISHYRMINHYKVQKMDHLVPMLMETEGTWIGNNFGKFLNNIPRDHLQRQLYMFSKIFDVNEAFDNIMNLNWVLFTEDFADSLAGLARHLDLDLHVHHGKTGYTPVEISDVEQDQLREMMEPEYRLLKMVRDEWHAPEKEAAD